MKIFLVFFLFVNTLFCEDLQSLLNDFEIASSNEIAQKTKKESLGHLVTYTSQDLKMMQAKTLKDVLKTLTKVSAQTNFLGNTNLTYAGNPNSISTSMRIYIDDLEVSSVQTLSPWAIYSDYPLDHISHIEFYYGESTVQLGNEPAKLTVKMYTKDASTVSGGTLRTSFSSRSSNSQSIVYGDEFKDSSLLMMLNSTKINRPTYYLNGQKILNNTKNDYGYFAYKKGDYTFSGGFSQINKDDFLSQARDAIPSSSNNIMNEYNIKLSKKFNEENGNIYLSYNQSDKKRSIVNEDEGILLSPITPLYKSVDEDLTYRKYDVGISNTFKNDKHSLFLAGVIKHKESKINSRDVVYMDDSTASNIDISRIKSETIYTLMSEYGYSINDANLLIANLKYDNYKKTGGVKDFDFVTPRIGYISTLNKNFSLKLFATRTFTPPSMFELDFASGNYNDLNNEVKDIYTFETSYQDEVQEFSLFLNYLKIKGMIVLNYKQGGYINSEDDNFNAKGFSARYRRHLNHNNKIDLNYYSYVNSAKTYGSPRSGGTIRAYQMFGDFSFYEELIYKQGYSYYSSVELDDSFNLSLGLKYNITKNLEIDFKAENILDDDMDILYLNYTDYSLFKIPNSTRTYSATIKWMF